MFSDYPHVVIASFTVLFLVTGCATTRTSQAPRTDSSPGTRIASPNQKSQPELDHWFVHSSTEKQLRAKNQTLGDELKELRNILRSRSEQIDQLKQRITTLESALEASASENEQTRKTLRELNRTLTEMESNQAKLQSRLTALRSELSDKQQSYETQINQLNQTMQSQKQTIDQLQSTKKNLQFRVQKLESRLKERSKRVKKLERTVRETEQANNARKQQLDRLRNDLRRVFDSIQSSRVRGGLLVNIEGGVLFPSGEHSLDDSDRTTLRKLTEVLSRHGTRPVSVIGHADANPVGSNYSSNWALSADRATSVMEYLVSQRGLAKTRVAVVGLGSQHPVFDNKTAQNRERNRRVEFLIGLEESQEFELPGTIFSGE